LRDSNSHARINDDVTDIEYRYSRFRDIQLRLGNARVYRQRRARRAVETTDRRSATPETAAEIVADVIPVAASGQHPEQKSDGFKTGQRQNSDDRR
jgi:hypothetical protein